MLKSNKFLFLVLLLLFFPFFLKPQMVGYDAYGFVNFVCQRTTIELLPLPQIAFNFFPCSIVFFKAILFGLTVVSFLILKKVAEYLNYQWGWVAPYFLLASPVWLDFLKFEDDVFAYPFLLAALYFFIVYLKEKKTVHYFFCLALCGIAMLTWKGSIYYLVAFLFGHPIGFVVALVLVYHFFSQFIGNILPNNYVWENYPIIGLGSQYWLLLGYYSVQTVLFPILLYWTVLVILKAKFAIHLGFILAILSSMVFGRLNEKQQSLLGALAVGSMLVVSLSVYTLPVNQEEHDAIVFANSYAQEHGLTLKNDLKYGYYMQFLGIEKPHNTPGNYDIVFWKNFKGIALTPFEINCVLIKEFGQNKVYFC